MRLKLSVSGSKQASQEKGIKMSKSNVKKTKYLVVGGVPYEHWGNLHFKLKNFGVFSTRKQAEKCEEKNWEDCMELIEIFEIE